MAESGGRAGAFLGVPADGRGLVESSDRLIAMQKRRLRDPSFLDAAQRVGGEEHVDAA